MMIAKALSKSGRRILKALMKFSKGRMAKKLEAQQQQQQWLQQRANNWQWRLAEDETRQDVKSIDTFLAYMPEEYGVCCCCHCDERDENQRNENLENEMMMC